MAATVLDIAKQIKDTLSENWSIHVDQIESYQIPEGGRLRSVRRASTVKSVRIYVCVYSPVYVSVFLHAPTLAAAKKKVDAGELWEEIRKEFEKKSVKWQRERELLEASQARLPGQQLALTHSPSPV